jgi:Uma2 family endonuclease
VRDYLAAGTKLVWLVYPDEKMVRVHRPDGTTELVQADGRLSGEELLPGFELALDELWGEK